MSASFLEYLQGSTIAATIGFGAGLVWTVFPIREELNIVTHPLSTLFWSSIYGSVIALGAEFVSDALPLTYKPLVPLSLIVSSVYYVKNSANAH